MRSQIEYRHLEFNVEVNMENNVFELGMCFINAKGFREVVENYAVKNGKRVRFIKNEPIKLRAICSKSSDWLIYASKVYREHTLRVKIFKLVHI